MDTWQNFPATLARGLFGSPRRAFRTLIGLLALSLLIPAFREAVWHGVIAPALTVVIILGILWSFFIEPFRPKKPKK